MILRGRGLVKRFGGLPAVDGVDLDAAPGEVLGVIGPNGAGKSTLLALLSGLINPSAGAVELDGRDLTGRKPHEIRRAGIATVLQTPRVFAGMTVRENAALGARFGSAADRVGASQARRAADAALADVGLHAKAQLPVTGLNPVERKALGLATALAGGPRVVLLDEVMAGLNPAELGAHVERLRAVRDRLGVTLIWVEHVMKAVTALADRVLVLDFGRVIAHGAPGDVMRDERVIEAYLGRGVGTHAEGAAPPRRPR